MKCVSNGSYSEDTVSVGVGTHLMFSTSKKCSRIRNSLKGKRGTGEDFFQCFCKHSSVRPKFKKKYCTEISLTFFRTWVIFFRDLISIQLSDLHFTYRHLANLEYF